MKRKLTKIQRIVLTAVVLVCVFISGALASETITRSIQVNYMGIKLVVNGITVTPRDSNGTKVEPFVYNGTTYLPVRAVGEALGQQVAWDGNTKTVYIGEVPNKELYLYKVCPPYSTSGVDLRTQENGKILEMAGKKYTNGYKFWGNGSALFNLNGQYQYMTMTVGALDNSRTALPINFYVDGEIVKTVEKSSESLPQQITVPLNYGLQLKIETPGTALSTVGLADIRIYK